MPERSQVSSQSISGRVGPNRTAPEADRRGLTTWLGLFVALVSFLLIRWTIRGFYHHPVTPIVIVREMLYFASAGILLILVLHAENLPPKTIGLGTSVWWKSVLWGLVTMLLCGGAAALLGMVTRNNNSTTPSFDRLPLWVCVLVIFRAGIVEELFYRGYAIERLRSLGAGRLLSATLPLILFAFGHYVRAWTDILQPLVLGGILTGFYLWRRDLVANILAHTLVDLVGTGAFGRILRELSA